MAVDPILYPHQCRMGRAAARMTRQKLAEMSGVSGRTICAFESPTPRAITKVNRAALRRALETTGVRFTGFGIDLLGLEKRNAG